MYFINYQLLLPVVTCNLYIINYKFGFLFTCSFQEALHPQQQMKVFMSMWRMDLRIRPYVISTGFYGIYHLGHIMIDWPLITCLIKR